MKRAPAIILGLALLACGCAQDGSALGDMTGGDLQPTLASLQVHVFGAICAECHNPNGPGPMPLDSEQATYDNLVGVTSFEVPPLLRVAAGDPENSYLIWKIEARDTILGDPMPQPPRPRLTPEQIAAIREWIAAGALR